jgi:DNA-binding NarL/FixJ family response regulator
MNTVPVSPSTDSPASGKIRVLLVDDHYVVRLGLVALLKDEEDIEIVGECEDGTSCLQRYRELHPDVVLMDLRLTNESGITVTSQLLGLNPAAKIVMFTTFDLEEDIYKALQAGASGYVLKSALDLELVQAIRKVFQGEIYISPRAESRLSLRNAGPHLTSREAEVLQLMSKGLTNKEIGDLLHCTDRTIKFHVKNILEKLQASDRTEAVTSAISRGLIQVN